MARLARHRKNVDAVESSDILSKESDLVNVFKDARKCTRCYPDKDIYVPLPDPRNSVGKSDIMFILVRPGRIGTGESGYVSFDNDDPTADFARECFEATGLGRESIFVTNACLCHPEFEGYRDKEPAIWELENCHHWLHQQLEIVQPLLIVTVGWSPLKSILKYYGHWPVRNKSTFDAWVGQLIDENDPWIFPVAHTSRKGRANRKADIQKSDWLEIPAILARAKKD